MRQIRLVAQGKVQEALLTKERHKHLFIKKHQNRIVNNIYGLAIALGFVVKPSQIMSYQRVERFN